MIIKNSKWKEEYYYEKLPNGLEVYLMEKKEYVKTYAAVAVNFGSLDTSFIPPKKHEFVDVPLGVSHFLEHLMFESNENQSIAFAKLGAECNAFTSFDRTVYTFSTISNVTECTNLLLDLVQNPKYDIKSIEHEKNSIIQELLMYDNIPNNVLYNECLKSMYKSCNVRYDICGTKESIEAITKKDLDLCYDAFYHPSNTCIVIVGNFDKNELLNSIKKNQDSKSFREFEVIKRRYPEEDNLVNEKKSIINYELSIPKVSLNLKIPNKVTKSIENLKNDLALSMLVDYNFDETSSIYEDLMNKEIINHSYSYESLVDDGFSYFMISCDTEKYEEFEQIIKKKMLNLEEIDDVNLIRYQNTIFASNIRKMNNLEYYVTMLIDACFCNLELFEIFDAVNEITKEDVNKMKNAFKEEQLTTVILKDEKHQSQN